MYFFFCFPVPKNVMPLSAGLFKSEHKNPVPQCPPRLHVQFLSHVLWSRMPNQFLKVDVSRISERQGWLVQCLDPLQFMSLHIPEENRSALCVHHCWFGTLGIRVLTEGSGVVLEEQNEGERQWLAKELLLCIFQV
jgi:hypothetical protein